MSIQEYRQRSRLGRFVPLRSLAALCVASTLLVPAPACADQTDPRLDALFAQLKNPAEPMAAIITEQQIWSIWLEPPDAAAQPHIDAGMGAMHRGDHAAAIQAFDEAVALTPEFAEAWNKRATAHYLAGNLDKSLADIEKVLALEPRHFGALSGRGLVYAKLGKLEGALQAFEAALAVHPQMTGARINAQAIRAILKKREI
jgi:tetratricopeptide (TPR) repeat protein